MWRYRGTPYYLSKAGERLGIPQVLLDRARNNSEIYRVSVLLAQLCKKWHKVKKDENGNPIFNVSELAQIQGTIHQTQQESAKLHALASAAQEMIDEEYIDQARDSWKP